MILFDVPAAISFSTSISRSLSSSSTTCLPSSLAISGGVRRGFRELRSNLPKCDFALRDYLPFARNSEVARIASDKLTHGTCEGGRRMRDRVVDHGCRMCGGSRIGAKWGG